LRTRPAPFLPLMFAVFGAGILVFTAFLLVLRGVLHW
jgi:hypothetical protein